MFGFYKTIRDWWTVGFADIDEKNSSGEPPLLLGAMSGSDFIVVNLLKKGANVNAIGEKFGTALSAAMAGS